MWEIIGGMIVLQIPAAMNSCHMSKANVPSLLLYNDDIYSTVHSVNEYNPSEHKVIQYFYFLMITITFFSKCISCFQNKTSRHV